MSAASVKTTVAALLDDAIDDLVTVKTQYPKIQSPSQMPMAIVWDFAFQQRVVDSGHFERTWKVITYVLAQVQDEDVDGAAFDAMLDAIVRLYQDPANRRLGGEADIDGESSVTAFGEAVDWRKWAVGDSQQMGPIIYEAEIETECREYVKRAAFT